MSGLLAGDETCGICGARRRCFELARAMRLRDVPEAATTGCVGCLSDGRFGFFHDTEAGYLDENGLTTYEPDEEEDAVERVFSVDPAGKVVGCAEQPRSKPVLPKVNDVALPGLRATPSFPTWNEVAWMVHCDDFMAYRGVWTSAQFNATARPSTGRELFVGMLDRDYHFLWPEDATEPRWGDVCIVVFECLACGLLRAAADFS